MTDKFDDLINNLTQEAKPVKCLKKPLYRIIPWIAAAILYSACAAYFIGMRHDATTIIKDPSFIFEILLVIYIGVSAALASAYLAVPDMCQKKWLVTTNLTATGIFAVWCVIKWYGEGMFIPHVDFGHCMTEGAFMAILPVAILIFMMKQGMTTHPILMGYMNVISITAIGYVALRFTCSADSISHGTISHLLPYVLLGAAMGIIARKLYKW